MENMIRKWAVNENQTVFKTAKKTSTSQLEACLKWIANSDVAWT